ncbi:MAG: hypothetical protein P8Y92_00860 [Halioglobus sp.]|jgi:hypothetical protein
MDALFTRHKRVIGPHDQKLGYIGECRIDIHDGSVTHVVLRTPWQSIELSWDQLEFDEERDAFRLQPSRRR